MDAGVTTTHDKYPPFSRAELQRIRDRAQWIGANLIDGNAAHSHLDLAQAADHLDAILARASAKPDLKLFDPNADTELYEPPAPAAAHLAGVEGRAFPASEVKPKPPLGAYPTKLWREDHPNPTPADIGLRRAHLLDAIDRYSVPPFTPKPEWFDELKELDAAPKSFTGTVTPDGFALIADAAPPHPEGGIDTGRRAGVLRALHRYHDLILSQSGLPSGLKTAAARLIHSELASIAVKLSPNPVDDVVLELLRALVPKPA